MYAMKPSLTLPRLCAVVVVVATIPACSHSELHEAAKRGRIKQAKSLLASGAQVDSLNHKNVTPLYVAVTYCQEEMTALLLSNGATVGVHVGGVLMTALHAAAQARCVESAKLLIDYDAPIDATDEVNKTPLHYAASFGAAQVAQLLIANGANANFQDAAGWTPLHYAANGGHADLAGLLLKSGADPLLQEKIQGATPLDVAVINGRDQVIQLLRQYTTIHGKPMPDQ